MKKLLLSTAVVAAVSAGMSSSASAALATGSTLDFDPGVAGGNYGFIVSGSYFAMDTNGSGTFTKPERTGLTQNDGLLVGSAQTASGSHSGAPGCTNGVGTCTNTGENPGIDAPWGFFGNTGMHYNSAGSLLSAAGNTATIDFSGWTVNWNGGDINMGSGGSAGVATVICAVDCAENDTYTIDYFATVPATDPGFGGVNYTLHLEGTVGPAAVVPVPAALWLFGSGLLGLVGVARRKAA